MIFLTLIGILAAADLLVKAWIEGQKASEFPRIMKKTKGKVMLYRNHNDGFPFGFMNKFPQIIKGTALSVTSAVAGVLFWLLPQKGNTVSKVALSLILGGGLSNLYDRLVRNYVIDYFSIQMGKLKKVVFNLGDIFIFAGTILLLLREFLGHRKY